MSHLDARIGTLCREGKTVYYAFVHGYGNPETVGTQEEIEIVLGLRTAVPEPEELGAVTAPSRGAFKDYIVTLRFEFPAWDETNGIPFEVSAWSKSEANRDARRQAEQDGHPQTGKGRLTFTAVEVERG